MKHFMKHFKKPLSLILALCMFLSVVGTGLSVLAAEVVEKQKAAKEGSGSNSVSTGNVKTGTEFDIKMDEWGEVYGSFNGHNAGASSTSGSGALREDIAAINADEMAKEMAKIINENYEYLQSVFTKENVVDNWQLVAGGGNRQGFVITDDAQGTISKLQRLYYNIGAHILQSESNGDTPSDRMAARVYDKLKASGLSQEIINMTQGDTYLLDQQESDWNNSLPTRTFMSWMFSFFHGYEDIHRYTMKPGSGRSSENSAQYYSVVGTDTQGKKYLTQYETVDNLPDKIPTASIWTNQFRHVGGSLFSSKKYITYFLWATTYGANNVNAYDSMVVGSTAWIGETVTAVKDAGLISDADTTSKTVLKAFGEVFTPELPAKDPASLSVSELKDFLSKAGKILNGDGAEYGNGISDMDVSVGTHFFTVENGYSENPFQQAKAFYEAVVDAAAEKYKETVNELYEQYNAVADTLDIETLESVKEELEGVAELYTILANAGKESEVQAAKAKYDELYGKITSTLETKYGALYDEAIADLVEAINNANVAEVKAEIEYVFASETKSTISGDTADNKIKNVADKYFDAAYYYIAKMGNAATDTPATLEEAIAYSVKESGVADAEFADSILVAVAGVKDLAEKNSAEVTVVNDPLWNTYNSIDEISDEYTYTTTLYKYIVNKEGKIPSKDNLVKREYSSENTTAKKDFEKWRSVFTDAFLNQDLSVLSIDVLEKHQYSAQSNLDEIQTKYSERVLNKYLVRPNSATVEEVEAFLAKFPEAFAAAFVQETNLFVDQWAGETAESIKADKDKMENFITYKNKLLDVYNTLTEELKAREDVAAAYNRLTQAPFGDIVNEVQQEYYIQQYLEAAAQMYPYFGVSDYDSFMSDSTVVESLVCTMGADDLSATYMIKMDVVTAYGNLNDTSKADARVLKHQILYNMFDTKRNDVITNANSWWSDVEGENNYYTNGVGGYEGWKTSIPFASANADTVDETNADELITVLDGLVNSDLAKKLINSLLATEDNPQPIGDKDNVNVWLYEQIINVLCSDDTINAILSLYPMFIQQIGEGTIGTLQSTVGGMYLEVPKLLDSAWSANDFVEARQVFEKHRNDGAIAAWQNAIAEKPHWIDEDLPTDKKVEIFMKAVGVALKGIHPFVTFLLTDEDLSLGLAGIVVGSDNNGFPGLKEELIPLLMNLGLDMTVAEANAWYNRVAQFKDGGGKGDTFSYYTALLTPIFDWLKNTVLTEPFTLITESLPKLAYMITRRHIHDGILNLIYPVQKLLNNSIISSVAGAMDLTPLIEDLIGDATSLDALIKKFVPDMGGFVLPTIPTAQLSRLAVDTGEKPYTESVGNLTPNSEYQQPKNLESSEADVLICLLRYAVDVLKANQGMLNSLLSSVDLGGFDLSSLISNLMTKDNDTIINALFALLYPDEPGNFDWKYADWTAVEMSFPEGIDSDRVNQALYVVDNLIENVFNLSIMKDLGLGEGGLTGLISSKLYSDATPAALAGMIYPMLEELLAGENGAVVKTIFDMLGIEITPAAVGAYWTEFEGAENLAGLTSFKDFDFNSITWNANSKEGFANALAAVLAPFNPVLEVLLTGDSITVENIEIKGGMGYRNSIVHILGALGCTAEDGLVTPDEYEAKYAGKDNAQGMLYEIILPVLSLVERIAQAPTQTLASILPTLAYFMDSNGLAQAVEGLVNPLVSMLQPVLDLVKPEGQSNLDFLSDIINSFVTIEGIKLDLENIEDQLIPIANTFLKNLDLGNGTTISVVLPEIDWSRAAGFGTQVNETPYGKTVTPDTAKVTYGILQYVAEALALNADQIKSLVGGMSNDETVAQIVDNVTKLTGEQLLSIIVNILVPGDLNLYGDWSFKKITQQGIEYTPNLTEEDYDSAIQMLDGMLPGLIGQFAGGGDLQSLVGNTLFTPEMMTKIASSIFGMLNSQTLTPQITTLIKEALGIDLTPYGFAEKIRPSDKQFGSLRKALIYAEKWEDVDWSKVDWGFQAGDEQGFLNSIAVLLRPFNGILGALLNGQDLYVLGELVIKGANGYNNAIIPLLEAFGCEDVLTAEEYAKAIEKNADNTIIAIVKPLLEVINKVLESPVDGLTKLLPNLAYFIYNDGITQLINNLVIPVTNVLETVAPIYDVDIDALIAPIADNASLVETLNNLLAGIKIGDNSLNVKLDEKMFENLASLGTPVVKESKRVDSSNKAMTRVYIEADQSAVLLTVLRFVVDTLKDNLDTIKGLLDGVDLGSLSAIVTDLFGQIDAMSTDAVIEMLLGMLGIGEIEDDTTDEDYTDEEYTEEETTEEETSEETLPEETPSEDTPSDNAQTEQTPEKESNLPLIIGLSVGGLLLLAAAIILIIYIKKRKAN